MASITRRAIPVTLLLAAFVVACTDTAGPNASPLDGLTQYASTDSAGTTPPPPVGTPAPGYFQGNVVGPSAPGAGNDSLSTAPRVAGVTVTAYAELDGDPVASVVTGADGRFALPTMPGGHYVVTFTPPPGSLYGGVWASAPIHGTSHTHLWWVVLWKR
jgi:hypothetical protein